MTYEYSELKANTRIVFELASYFDKTKSADLPCYTYEGIIKPGLNIDTLKKSLWNIDDENKRSQFIKFLGKQRIVPLVKCAIPLTVLMRCLPIYGKIDLLEWLGDDYVNKIVPAEGMRKNIFINSLPVEIKDKWDKKLSKKYKQERRVLQIKTVSFR